ncbi:histidine kinase [Pseudomonas putida]|uniref:Histidine kinase n=1 Tax=Pseudomonas putida TaxID=303 RepID=A0A6I6Y2L2_PSEPU|nr:histidine kinase [Pseudomonas putida]QHG66689.1 histidine kinase [Pseudomonas putida]
MRQPYVLIHHARPSHQILLHQACNAIGLFNVRITHDKADLDTCLARKRCVDLLILDHTHDPALLDQLGACRALLFVGRADPGRSNLAREARRQGIWVLADLPLPLPMPRWQQALQRIQTVTSPTHAH